MTVYLYSIWSTTCTALWPTVTQKKTDEIDDDTGINISKLFAWPFTRNSGKYSQMKHSESFVETQNWPQMLIYWTKNCMIISKGLVISWLWLSLSHHFGHRSTQNVWQKYQILRVTLNHHISGLESAFDKISKPKIIYRTVASSSEGQNNSISCLDNSISC